MGPLPSMFFYKLNRDNREGAPYHIFALCLIFEIWEKMRVVLSVALYMALYMLGLSMGKSKKCLRST